MVSRRAILLGIWEASNHPDKRLNVASDRKAVTPTPAGRSTRLLALAPDDRAYDPDQPDDIASVTKRYQYSFHDVDELILFDVPVHCTHALFLRLSTIFKRAVREVWFMSSHDRSRMSADQWCTPDWRRTLAGWGTS